MHAADLAVEIELQWLALYRDAYARAEKKIAALNQGAAFVDLHDEEREPERLAA